MKNLRQLRKQKYYRSSIRRFYNDVYRKHTRRSLLQGSSNVLQFIQKWSTNFKNKRHFLQANNLAIAVEDNFWKCRKQIDK